MSDQPWFHTIQRNHKWSFFGRLYISLNVKNSFKDQSCNVYERYDIAGLILGLRPANERRRYKVNAVSHWLGANLESA